MTDTILNTWPGPRLLPPQPTRRLASAPTDSAESIARRAEPSVLPKALYPAVIAALQKDASADYDISGAGLLYQALSAAQQLHVDFTPEGVKVRPRIAEQSTWHWEIRLVSCGYGEALTPVVKPELVAAGNRLEYRRGNLVEWYINSPQNIEQGFTLDAPPDGRERDESLVIELLLSGNLEAVLCNEAQTINLFTQEGKRVLAYDKLRVEDACGHALPAHLELARDLATHAWRLRIVVEDRQAIYPIVIDPTVFQNEQVKLHSLVPGLVNGDGFGSSVAISSNRTVIVVGAYGKAVGGVSGAGAVYVFEQDTGTLALQLKATLTAGTSA